MLGRSQPLTTALFKATERRPHPPTPHPHTPHPTVDHAVDEAAAAGESAWHPLLAPPSVTIPAPLARARALQCPLLLPWCGSPFPLSPPCTASSPACDCAHEHPALPSHQPASSRVCAGHHCPLLSSVPSPPATHNPPPSGRLHPLHQAQRYAFHLSSLSPSSSSASPPPSYANVTPPLSLNTIRVLLAVLLATSSVALFRWITGPSSPSLPPLPPPPPLPPFPSPSLPHPPFPPLPLPPPFLLPSSPAPLPPSRSPSSTASATPPCSSCAPCPPSSAAECWPRSSSSTPAAPSRTAPASSSSRPSTHNAAYSSSSMHSQRRMRREGKPSLPPLPRCTAWWWRRQVATRV